MIWLDYALRAAVISQLAFIAILLVRAGWPLSRPRRMALWFTLSTAAYMVCSAPEPPARGLLYAPLAVLSIAGPVLFWWFAAAVFEDSFRLRAYHWVALSLFLVLNFTTGGPIDAIQIPSYAPALRAACRLAALGFILLGLWIAFRDRTDDLFEPRRRFRDWLIAVVGLQTVIVTSTELALGGQPPPLYLDILNVTAILLITHLAAHAFVRVRGQLFDASPRVSADVPPANVKDTELLVQLRRAMEEACVYRQEGLTIALLAQKLNTQEHTLRRAINQGLGFRNFSVFLNTYRVREAAERLRVNDGRRLPVLTVALDVGYSSIGPFNRAFKKQMGMTPTEYRSALAVPAAVAQTENA